MDYRIDNKQFGVVLSDEVPCPMHPSEMESRGAVRRDPRFGVVEDMSASSKRPVKFPRIVSSGSQSKQTDHPEFGSTARQSKPGPCVNSLNGATKTSPKALANRIEEQQPLGTKTLPAALILFFDEELQ